MPIINIEGREFRITNGFLRTLSLRDDKIDEIGNPELIISACRKQHIPADMLMFTQQLTELTPNYSYYMEWDNLAAVPISTYEHWLKNQIHQNTRNKIRKASKSGVVVKVESISRKLAEGLVSIFNESKVRRGKLYSYYGKDVDTVEKEWSTDINRSKFLVAYYQDEIIGFIQLVYNEILARTSGTIAKLSHRDKAPMNALFAKAVEICAENGIRYLVYGKYIYGEKGDDSLTEFKKKNGFQKIEIPTYYVPLSLRGKIGLQLGLHHGISGALPSNIKNIVFRLRSVWYERSVSH